MIRFILLQNRQGKTRLAKYYVPLGILRNTRLNMSSSFVVNRDPKFTNFVEFRTHKILDHFFSNVCELDLVFNFHKVYLILDEFILAGELQETSKKAIIERMGELEKLD
ncbi:hypothetical protein F8388_026676 [Cannabis sativa]|uniref:AP complex subunit sigma n=1 Tax=Cannabis sativa TaxID=3483 RepID=A0A7J6H186_CANSA|nr:hypothetical protein F8388_026676 [Cannabis sativa]